MIVNSIRVSVSWKQINTHITVAIADCCPANYREPVPTEVSHSVGATLAEACVLTWATRQTSQQSTPATDSIAFDTLILSPDLLLNCKSGKPFRRCTVYHCPVLQFPAPRFNKTNLFIRINMNLCVDVQP